MADQAENGSFDLDELLTFVEVVTLDSAKVLPVLSNSWDAR